MIWMRNAIIDTEKRTIHGLMLEMVCDDDPDANRLFDVIVETFGKIQGFEIPLDTPEQAAAKAILPMAGNELCWDANLEVCTRVAKAVLTAAAVVGDEAERIANEQLGQEVERLRGQLNATIERCAQWIEDNFAPSGGITLADDMRRALKDKP